jgi:hypothetical protein
MENIIIAVIILFAAYFTVKIFLKSASGKVSGICDGNCANCSLKKTGEKNAQV